MIAHAAICNAVDYHDVCEMAAAAGLALSVLAAAFSDGLRPATARRIAFERTQGSLCGRIGARDGRIGAGLFGRRAVTGVEETVASEAGPLQSPGEGLKNTQTGLPANAAAEKGRAVHAQSRRWFGLSKRAQAEGMRPLGLRKGKKGYFDVGFENIC